MTPHPDGGPNRPASADNDQPAPSMTDMNHPADSRAQRMLATARRRWPIVAGVVATLILAVVLFTRSGGKRVAEDAATESKAAASDSIVRLDTAAQRMAGIELLTLSASASGALVANGTITYDANRVSTIAPRTEGRVTSVRADLGQTVGAGTQLAVLESPEVGQTRSDLARARVNLDIARRNFERERRLFEQQISPQKEMLEAENVFRTSQADYDGAIAKLRAFGASDAGGRGASYGITTPVSGVVVERNASPGQIAGPTTNLFVVADLRSVWITVDVYEGDVVRVQNGASAVVTASALPNATFPGRVTYAGGIVDTASRTFKVRVAVDNFNGRLRPGMFAQVRITTPASGVPAGASSITVPEVAVQDLNGKPVVFVATSKAGEYVARPVTVGPSGGNGMLTLTKGVSNGDRIVTKGAFQLRSELLKASFGED